MTEKEQRKQQTPPKGYVAIYTANGIVYRKITPQKPPKKSLWQKLLGK